MRRVLLSLALTILPLAAGAHELAKGPNGGRVVDSAGRHVEMVADGTQLTLFLTGDADQPLASAGSKNARAIVQDGGRMATIPLQSAEPNKLVGTLPQPLGRSARIVVSATMADGHAVQARFAQD